MIVVYRYQPYRIAGHMVHLVEQRVPRADLALYHAVPPSLTQPTVPLWQKCEWIVANVATPWYVDLFRVCALSRETSTLLFADASAAALFKLFWS